MRYIIDDRGYVKYCSNNYITCENKTCTSYEGTIPDGYETIEEWVQNANIRAYKIVAGNLVFDAEEDARLQEEYNECTEIHHSKVIKTTETIEGNKVLSIDTGISDADKIWIDCSNSYMYNNNNTVSGGRLCYPIPFNVAPSETSTYVVCRMNGTKIELLSNGGWNHLWTKVIIIRYTKGE